MKALTIHQPWASLIAIGAKRIETRPWPTKYRGPLAIHAGKQWGPNQLKIAKQRPFVTAMNDADIVMRQNIPLGCVIAIADLVDCLLINYCDFDKEEATLKINIANHITVSGDEYFFGDYSAGRYAWILANVRQIEPVPAKGMQRLWNWEGP